jgi:hypothetical protein
VRPNGDTFGKKEILADLRLHSMQFTSFEMNDDLIRTKGSVGILTAADRSTAVRDGVEIKTHARQWQSCRWKMSGLQFLIFNQRT